MSIQSAAISANGQEAIQTTKVYASLQGEQILSMTFRNTAVAGTAAKRVIIKAGPAMAISALPANGGADEFETEGFDNYGQLQEYYKNIESLVAGFRVSTDDTTNLDGKFEFTSRSPDGQTKLVKQRMGDKLALGGGTYANEIKRAEGVKDFPLSRIYEIAFNGLQPQSYITFEFYMKGWNKTTDLAKLVSSDI